MTQYKMKIYDNNRAYIQINQGNPFIRKSNHKRTNYKRNNNGWMTIKNTKRAHRNWIKKLIALNIDCSKCKFITLTLSRNMQWKELMSKFEIFINNIKRKYGKDIVYIRSVEIQEESLRYHVHIVLVFNDKVPQFKRRDIQKLWQYGNIDIENKVYDIYGLIEYLTLDKHPIGRQEDSRLSYFPKGARLIASTFSSKADCREINVNENEIINAVTFCKGKKSHIRNDKHFYYVNGKKIERLDGILLSLGEDYIINNFGTAEDDKLLAEINRNKTDS